MSSESEAAPLAGVRVIDFGQYIAGPLAAMIMADLGADVVRVDPPEGPSWDHPASSILNRNKRSIALDLHDPEDARIARQLISTADVVLENFRPGVMERFGLGAPELTTAFPKLVYLSMPGFASSDGEMRDIRAWEAIVSAAVGQFSDMGLTRVLMGVKASFSPLPLASVNAAVLGAMASVLALFSRIKTGHGDTIEVPLAAALAEGLAYNSMLIEGRPKRYSSLREQEVARRRQAGEPLNINYSELLPYLDATYRTYECADGRQFSLAAGSHASHTARALTLLGLLESATADGLPMFDPYLPTSLWPSGANCTLRSSPLSFEWNRYLATRIGAALVQEPSSHWETLFGEGKVPSVAVRTTQEWLREDHPSAAGLLADVEDPRYGTMRQPANAAWLGGTALQRPAVRPAPALDADREAILDELDKARASEGQLSETDVKASPATGWLDGITVLDLTNVIAGPTAAGTLARFGAEVIRLDQVRPRFSPLPTVIYGLQSNRGKRTALVDITTTRGRQVLEGLIKRVDVVTINATEQQLTALGLDEESLTKLNPNIVICQVDTWGGPSGGPWRNRLGYDEIVQAAVGIMTRFGGGPQTPEEHAHVGTIDVLTGYAGALATAVALYARGRGVMTHLARASLAAAGQLVQIPFMFDYAGRPPFDEPAGPQARGAGPLYRCYQTADGWVFLACTETDVPALIGELDIERPGSDAALEENLERAFAGTETDDVVERLRRLGIAAQRLESIAEVRARFLPDSDGGNGSTATTLLFERNRNHPSGYAVELIARCAVRTARSAITPPTPTPKPGTESRAILADLGYSSEEIEAMINDQVVRESWSEEYLPS